MSCGNNQAHLIGTIGGSSGVLSLPTCLQPAQINVPILQPAGVDPAPFILDNLFIGFPLRDARQVAVGIGSTFFYVQDAQRNIFNGFEDEPGMASRVSKNELLTALRVAANYFGQFIVEGEMTYEDWEEWPHRTAAQALAVNQHHAKTVAIRPRLSIRRALWVGKDDLTSASETDRIYSGEEIAEWLLNHNSEIFRYIHPSFNLDQKESLVAYTRKHGHRELWIDSSPPYSQQQFVETGAIPQQLF